jgi:hypothetical protein
MAYLTSQQRGEAPVPPQPEGLRGFWPGALLLVGQRPLGYSPSSRRAPSQNSQQRRYTSLGLGALVCHRGKFNDQMLSWISHSWGFYLVNTRFEVNSHFFALTGR